ncbi:MAG: prephenate dehydrogenase [Dehalococcoidales bacterium]|nr:prephenate dehydrogenase [Dehalococcoidales bacterium]
MKIAIIGGSGNMGLWFARFALKEGHRVTITGRNKARLREAGKQLTVEATTDNIEAVRRSQVVLISVPIDNFEAVVEQIGPHTNSDQLIIDITSVKVLPMAAIHRHIKSRRVLGMHPMFGPGARDIANRSFMLTPTNEEEKTIAERAREYLEKREAKVTLVSPEEHDEIMTVVLGLSHFIAIVAGDTILRFNRLRQVGNASGITFKLLSTLTESVISEEPELYASLQMSLPNLAEAEKEFQEKAQAWADLVANKDRDGFARKMKTLKARFNTIHPDFGKAYEDMYKLLDML